MASSAEVKKAQKMVKVDRRRRRRNGLEDGKKETMLLVGRSTMILFYLFKIGIYVFTGFFLSKNV
jgi:hypothetical protein